jgi:hypothetical protein
LDRMIHQTKHLINVNCVDPEELAWLYMSIDRCG